MRFRILSTLYLDRMYEVEASSEAEATRLVEEGLVTPESEDRADHEIIEIEEIE